MIVVGLMSGTSADGIDISIVDITHTQEGKEPVFSLKSLHFETLPWSEDNRALIFKTFSPTSTVVDVCRANFILGEAFANATLQALKNANINPKDIIGSHGQTVWHDVDANGKVTSTLQIGEGGVIAARTGLTTISNFRVADVALGGQGAPLASTFDYLLMRPTGDKWRALQNIGGIGNVSFIPPKGVDDVDPLAFDTGPGNVLMDWYVTLITNGELKCDMDGKMGRKGEINQPLLTDLLSHPYLSQKPPKSTGRELYTKEFIDNVAKRASAAGVPNNDVIATLTEFTAISIVDSYRKWGPGNLGQVIIGGGGSRNPFLLDRIKFHLHQLDKDIELLLNENLGINSEGKESLFFALLGYLCFHGLPGNVPKCTGASSPTILGNISPGLNFHSLLLKNNVK